MHHQHLHTRLGEASHAPLVWLEAAPETAILEAHASEGCSPCARALVNARELAVELALAEAPIRPRERFRRSVLDRTRGTLAARRAAAPAGGIEPVKPRSGDPSSVVAHMHIRQPAEAERTLEIDALRAGEERPGDGSARMLSQLARFLDFAVFFVSIVRGERVGYRVKHGLSDNLGVFREMRREMSYCTHCVSGEAPLVIENAFLEPFFRGSKAATRFGVGAYVGVPLRTSRGILIGTLCALDFAPRTLAVGTVPLLEVFARRAVMEIEHERSPELRAGMVEASSDRGDVCSRAFFRDLLVAEHARTSAERSSALIGLHAEDPAQVLEWIDQDETVGRIDGTAFGILVPGAAATAIAERLARLRAAAGASAVSFSTAAGAQLPVDDWIANAFR
jgi:hypothetical protein